jgi:hypothetical protein
MLGGDLRIGKEMRVSKIKKKKCYGQMLGMKRDEKVF